MLAYNFLKVFLLVIIIDLGILILILIGTVLTIPFFGHYAMYLVLWNVKDNCGMPMSIAIILCILLFPFGFVVLVLLIVCCPIYSVAFGILLYYEKRIGDDNRIDEIGLRPISDHNENSEINYGMQNFDYAYPRGDNININSMMESARSPHTPRKDA